MSHPKSHGHGHGHTTHAHAKPEATKAPERKPEPAMKAETPVPDAAPAKMEKSAAVTLALDECARYLDNRAGQGEERLRSLVAAARA